MSRADQLRAELKVAELEDKLIAAKQSGKGVDKAKHDLRAARAEHRRLRAGEPVAEGDAVASPDTIKASATVEETG